jgi:hypothetical protein
VLVTSTGRPPTLKTIADSDGEIARLFAARRRSSICCDPTCIAGRWKDVVASEILKTASLCLGSETP